MRNLVTILPFKAKLSGKFQCFNAINESTELLKNSCISKHFKMKNFKTFYEAKTAGSLKGNNLTSLDKKFSYGDLQEYTNIYFPSASKMQFLGV